MCNNISICLSFIHCNSQGLLRAYSYELYFTAFRVFFYNIMMLGKVNNTPTPTHVVKNNQLLLFV